MFVLAISPHTQSPVCLLSAESANRKTVKRVRETELKKGNNNASLVNLIRKIKKIVVKLLTKKSLNQP